MQENWQKIKGGTGREGGCQTDGLNFVWAISDLIESEKSSSVTITIIPVARATMGFNLSDNGKNWRGNSSQTNTGKSSTPSLGKTL